jgi:hypothetical protein
VRKVDAKGRMGYTFSSKKRRERIMATKKRKPQDATMRNIRAANKKIQKLNERMKKLEKTEKKKANK